MAKSKKIDKDMGVRLKKARLDQKLTYDELSEKSGVSSRYIKEIENHGNVPSLEKLGQLIRALHISADPFFYPAAPTDNLDYQRLLVYLSECTDDQITTILALVENELDPLYPYNFQKILCALQKAQPTPFHIPDSPFPMLYLHFPIHLCEQNTLVLLLRF